MAQEAVKVMQTQGNIEMQRRSFPKVKSLFNKEITQKRMVKERELRNSGYRSGDKFEEKQEFQDNKMTTEEVEVVSRHSLPEEPEQIEENTEE